jgi:hypothetical protein
VRRAASDHHFTQKRYLLLAEITLKGRPATQDDALIRHPDIRFAAIVAARSARMAGVILVTAAMVITASFAQTVPVPKPAPKGRDGGPAGGGPAACHTATVPPPAV